MGYTRTTRNATMVMSGDIIPDVTDTRKLGSSSIEFADLYLENLRGVGAYLYSQTHFCPGTDDAIDLGIATKEWRNISIDGVARLDALLLDNIVTKNSAYTTTVFDSIILLDSSGGAFTVTLAPAADVAGQVLVFKKTDSGTNAITLDGNASETIDGAETNAEMNAQYDMLIIISDGSNWHIIGRKIA